MVHHPTRLAIAVLLSGACLVAIQSAAQSDTALTLGPTPDFSGVWVYRSATPLQRPEELKDRPLLTDTEVAEFRARARRLFSDASVDAPPGDQLFLAVLANAAQYRNLNSTQSVGLDPSTVEREFDNRTSLIVDPLDGRIPALTPEGQRRQALNAARSFTLPTRLVGDVTADEIDAASDRLPIPGGPADLANSTRCITWGVPRVGANSFFTSHYQIFQTTDHVAIVQEVNHDVRLIPLDSRPALSSRIRQWNGDPRGRWEDQTLVVETANFSAKSYFFGSTDNLRLIERFTRSDQDTLAYEVTITDPATWVSPWTVQVSLRRRGETLYEFACHEGNYETMRGILAGARARD
jgi:hypothetical protein